MTVTEDPSTAAPAKEVGQARKRKEDARLITGKTTWTDNMALPGMLHLAVVRSPVAHAKITNVDVSAAKAGAQHHRRLHRGRLRRRAGLAALRLAGHARTWSTPDTPRSPSRRSTTSVRPSR